jgi:hypothetical protein
MAVIDFRLRPPVKGFLEYLCNMSGMQAWIQAANGFLADRFLYASS